MKKTKTSTSKCLKPSEIFAANLRGLMAIKNVSPAEMQEYMQISATTYYKRMNRPHEFTMSNVESAARKLGVPAGDMLARVMEVDNG